MLDPPPTPTYSQGFPPAIGHSGHWLGHVGMKKALIDNGKSGPQDRKLGAISSQTISTVLEAAATGAVLHAILVADRSGTILWVNDAFTRLCSYSAEKLPGQNTRLLKSGQHSEAFYRKQLESGLGRRETWRSAKSVSGKDGSLYRRRYPPPHSRRQRRNRHFVCIKLDVTTHATSRRPASGQTEEQFRHLAENIREIFFVLTPDPVRMEYISPAP